jgi:hypothetical protein
VLADRSPAVPNPDPCECACASARERVRTCVCVLTRPPPPHHHHHRRGTMWTSTRLCVSACVSLLVPIMCIGFVSSSTKGVSQGGSAARLAGCAQPQCSGRRWTTAMYLHGLRPSAMCFLQGMTVILCHRMLASPPFPTPDGRAPMCITLAPTHITVPLCVSLCPYIYITAPLYIYRAPIHNTVPLDISLCPHVYHCTPIYITVPLYIHRPIYITLRPYI